MSLRYKIALANSTGISYLKLSQEYKLAYNTVRNICIAYKEGGFEGLYPRYSNCGAKGKLRLDYFIYRCCCWLRKCHPSWGADTVIAKLALRYPDKKMPSSRIVHTWFVKEGLVVKKTRVQ